MYSIAYILLLKVYEGRPRIEKDPDAFIQGMKHITEQGYEGISERPGGMSQGLWSILQSCWQFYPLQRPTMSAVEVELHNLDRIGLV